MIVQHFTEILNVTVLTVKKYISISYFFIDILLIGISLYIPYCLRYSNSPIPKALPYLKEAVFLFVLWWAILTIFLQNRQLYSTDRSLAIPKEIWRVFVCVAVSSVLAGLLVFVLQMKLFSRIVFTQSFLLLFFNLSFWRVIKRTLIRNRISKGFYNLNVLIIGAGKVGLTLAQEFESAYAVVARLAAVYCKGAVFSFVPSCNGLAECS